MSRTLEAEYLLQTGEQPPAELQEALERLMSARRATALYQESHPMAVAARDSAYEAVQGLLRNQSSLTLTAQESGLLVNRKNYRQSPDTRSLARRMLQRGIRSVSFMPHFDPAELANLISLLEADPDRLREQGGPLQKLRHAGVTGITLGEVDFREEETDKEPEPQEQTRLQSLNIEELVALLSDYLLGKVEEIDDRVYEAMIQLLKDPAQVVRLLTECVNRAGAASLEGGRAAFVAQMLQRLEAVILAHSPDDWEKIKASVRQAIGRLPPALRPKIFSMEMPDWEQRRQEMQGGQEAALAQLPGLLSQLSHRLGALRGTPSDLPRQVTNGYASAGVAAAVPADSGSMGGLSRLLEGMAAMRLGPVPVRREMADLMDTTAAEQAAARAAAVLVEVADRETELDNYSKLSTELENRAKSLADSNLAAALSIVEMTWAHVADNRQDFAWRRMRARLALDAIGNERIIQMAASALSKGIGAHIQAAAHLLAKLGQPGIAQLARTLTEGLPAESETAAADALVEVGDQAVDELAVALESGHSSARVPVARVLARIGGERALAALGRGLNAPDMLVRLGVVQCLGTTASEAAVEILARALGDANAAVREAAIVALGTLRSRKAVDHLGSIALDKNLSAQTVAHRRKAISSLVLIGTKEALQIIETLARRRTFFRRAANEQIREAAQRALREAQARPAEHGAQNRGQTDVTGA